MPKEDNFEEFSELTALVTSKEWKYFIVLLNKRKEFLQNKVNQYVRDQKLMEAFGALSRHDDIGKTIVILTNRLAELAKERENG